MKLKFSIVILAIYLLTALNTVFSVGLEDRVIKLSSNERFDLVQGDVVTFKFQPLSNDARKLEITNDATALGVAYLGQVTLKENTTTLSALRSIADQIGESLGINFGVVADSNTSEALQANEMLLLYHPHVTITLALARPDAINDYEILCTYALKDLDKNKVTEEIESAENPQQVAPKADNDIAPVEDVPASISN